MSQWRVFPGNLPAITPKRIVSVNLAEYENGAVHVSFPKHIVDGKYVDLDLSEFESSGQITDQPVRDYGGESYLHYHQFVDACLGKDTCTAPFSSSARLTETILLGVIAGRFPGKTLHWDNNLAKFKEEEANQFLDSPYREF